MKNNKKHQRLILDQKGFTLTEMLIVIALIALIGSTVTLQLVSKFDRAKVDQTKIQMRQLSVILQDFKRECGFYPSQDQGLDALVKKPTSGRECKNYDPNGYIAAGGGGVGNAKVPKDAWNNDFLYTSEGNTFELRSLGADGKEGGEGTDKDLSSNDAE